jgi:hypothetical protein
MVVVGGSRALVVTTIEVYGEANAVAGYESGVVMYLDMYVCVFVRLYVRHTPAHTHTHTRTHTHTHTRERSASFTDTQQAYSG